MSETEKIPPLPPTIPRVTEFESVEQRTQCCGCNRSVPKKVPITILTALWGFLTNVERAIILPTMWLYFTTYWSGEVAKTWYGWTMASFGLSVLLFTPAYGYAAYCGVQTKYLLIFANAIELLGNLAYLIAQQPWVVLAGRFISGVGGGCDTPMYADLARTTSAEERTPYMTMTYVAKQVGIVFGPVCTLLMHKLRWNVGEFKLSVYNGPGLLMSGLWTFHTLLVILFYPLVEKPTKCVSNVIGPSGSSEKDKLLGSDPNKACCCSCDCGELEPYKSYAVFTMYLMVFATYFSVMSLETVIPPIADVHFHWNEVKVSYVYLGASGLLIIMCLVLHILSKYHEDRRLALIGFLVLVCAYIWLFVVTYLMDRLSIETGAPLIIAGVAIHVIGMPLALAVTESLYTKMVPPNDLDRALSYLRCVSNFAFLMGPLEGGLSVRYACLAFAGNLLISSIALGLLAWRYHLFLPKTAPSTYSLKNVDPRES